MVALQKQSSQLQAQDPLPLSLLPGLNFIEDEFAALPTLEEYIETISIRQARKNTTDFEPHQNS